VEQSPSSDGEEIESAGIARSYDSRFLKPCCYEKAKQNCVD
jgi:hypothetical protein